MQLRILSYNIHKCIGALDRRYRPERIRDVVSHYRPDIVLLQEVDSDAHRSERHRQVDLLGDMLGLAHRTWFPNVKVRFGGQYGNAILSRFHFTETANVDLTITLKKRRSALHARFRVRVGRTTRTLHVYNLHLGLSGLERKLQLRRFLASEPLSRLHERTPILIAGDFNDVYGTLARSVLEPAQFRGPSEPPRTYPAFAPVRALDSVYVRGSLALRRVHRSQLELARLASDHLPLIAELELT